MEDSRDSAGGRERIKVQRGWKTVKTPLAEGKRIQYNFVKPHMALEGKTPAQAAGIDVKGWKRLHKGDPERCHFVGSSICMDRQRKGQLLVKMIG